MPGENGLAVLFHHERRMPFENGLAVLLASSSKRSIVGGPPCGLGFLVGHVISPLPGEKGLAVLLVVGLAFAPPVG